MKYFLLVTLLALAACQTSQEIAKNQQAVTLAEKNLFLCGQKGAAMLDDKVSPANVVARAVGQYCSDKITAYVDALSTQAAANYEPFDGHFLYQKLLNEGFLNDVLLHRSGKAGR